MVWKCGSRIDGDGVWIGLDLLVVCHFWMRLDV